MKKLLRIINSIASFLLIIVFSITVILVVHPKISGENSTLFGYQIKSVLSGSMEPEIKTGSIVFIETGGNLERFTEGDIITYKANNDHMVVTHRITEVKSDGAAYVTKGDANNRQDTELVSSENIIGEYTGLTIPYLGYALNFANTQKGVLFLLIIPGIVLLLYSFVTIGKAIRMTDQLKNEMQSGDGKT